MREDTIVLKTEVLDIDSDEIESSVNFVDIGTMEEMGIDDEMEEEEEELPDESVELEEWLGGEGATLIHGRAALTTNNRGDLFSPNLEQKLRIVFCNLCLMEIPGLSSWRSHCLKQHLSAPGYGPKLVRERGQTFFFNKNPDLPHQCPRCKRCFSSSVEMEEHHHSAMRTVRLICCQCRGQYGDMETHIKDSHEGEACGVCGEEVGAAGMVAHAHNKHKGFRSVIAETSSTCTGDGITMEVFETVLETSARFLATEVKPQVYDNMGKATKKFIVKEKPQNRKSWPVTFRQMEDEHIRKEMESGVDHDRMQRMIMTARKHGRWRIAPELNQVMTEEDRYEYNVRELHKFRASGVGLSRNECEICGFVPYTKNKYREKQDHLAKFHFKEKIDSILPAMRPYNCPDEVCDYIGKDRQDVLRHYTGKHNVLKNWVDTFLREQLHGEEPPEEITVEWDGNGKDKIGNKSFTFKEMEKMAIERERITTRKPLKARGRAKMVTGLATQVGTKMPGVGISQTGPRLGVQPGAGSSKHVTINQVSRNPIGCSESPGDMFVSAKYEKANNSLNWDVVSLIKSRNVDTFPAKIQAKTGPGVAQDMTKVRCSYCDKLEVFDNTQLWKEHCEKVHREVSKQKVEELVRKIGRYSSNSFREEDKFECDEEVQFLCNTCDKLFSQQNALSLHKQSCIGKQNIAIEDKLRHCDKDVIECVEPPKKKVKRPPPPLVHIDQIKNFTSIIEQD